MQSWQGHRSPWGGMRAQTPQGSAGSPQVPRPGWFPSHPKAGSARMLTCTFFRATGFLSSRHVALYTSLNWPRPIFFSIWKSAKVQRYGYDVKCLCQRKGSQGPQGATRALLLPSRGQGPSLGPGSREQTSQHKHTSSWQMEQQRRLQEAKRLLCKGN